MATAFRNTSAEQPIIIDPTKRAEFCAELASLINRYSLENGSNTPDFILAEHLACSLELFNVTVRLREEWSGRPTKDGSEPLGAPA